MAITRSMAAKARAKHGLQSRLPQLRKAHVRSRDNIHPSILRPVRVTKAKPHVRRHRLQRIHDSNLGPKPIFPGTIVMLDPFIARLEDVTRLRDIENALESRQAQVYWVDGSNRDGFLSAGVVWLEHDRLYSGGYQLGPNTGGDSSDAEVFAIAAALGRAKKYFQRGHQLELVRVFSDAREILKHIKHGTCHTIGPLLVKKTALEGLYARAHWLRAHNVRVELVWVEGYAKSEGNQSADAVAFNAVSEQMTAFNTTPLILPIAKTADDVPDLWQSLGQDWVDEWLWRANKTQAVTSQTRIEDVRKKQIATWQRSHDMQRPPRFLVFKYKNGASETLGAKQDSDIPSLLDSATKDTQLSSNGVFDLASSPATANTCVDQAS